MRYVSAILLLFTVLVIAIQSNYTTIYNISDKHIQLVTDRLFHRGDSSGEVLHHNVDTLKYSCDLLYAYKWPFCEVEYSLNDHDGRGIDFTKYDNLHLKLSMRVNGNDELVKKVRVYLKQDSEELSHLFGLKAHQIGFVASDYPNGIEIPLNLFKVADWWVKDFPVSVFDAGTDLSNIISLSISTPAEAILGSYEFEVEHIYLSGKLISDEVMYTNLFRVWMLFSIVNLGYSLFAYYKKNNQLSGEYSKLVAINDKHKSLAFYDSLTGALNRHGTEKVIESLKKSNLPACLIILDLDRFKRVNDIHGHKVGDDVLASFAEIIHGTLQKNESLIRWGGEEFVILVTNGSSERVESIVASIQREMVSYPWPKGLKITCSMGSATNLHSDTSVDDLFLYADLALYHSKETGRNKYTSYNEIAIKGCY